MASMATADVDELIRYDRCGLVSGLASALLADLFVALQSYSQRLESCVLFVKAD